MMYFRYLLAAPAILGVLALFGLYHWGRRNGMGKPPLEWIWAIAVGLPMGIGNVLFNVFIGTWIFWKLPPLRNADGELSPFFTTRIKTMRGDPLAEHFVAMVNTMDPGHFGPP